MRVAFTGLTMAEYFRDGKHQDVLLFIDNIFRLYPGGLRGFRPAGPYALAPWATSPRWPRKWAPLQERITSTKNGSITSVQAVYVPADDLTDPAPATTFAHLDATTVLSRSIVQPGHLSGCGSAGVQLPHPDAGRGGQRALRGGARRAAHPAAV